METQKEQDTIRVELSDLIIKSLSCLSYKLNRHEVLHDNTYFKAILYLSISVSGVILPRFYYKYMLTEFIRKQQYQRVLYAIVYLNYYYNNEMKNVFQRFLEKEQYEKNQYLKDIYLKKNINELAIEEFNFDEYDFNNNKELLIKKSFGRLDLTERKFKDKFFWTVKKEIHKIFDNV